MLARTPSRLPQPSPSWERETDLKPLAASDPEPGAVPPPYWVHSSTCQAHWDSRPLCLHPFKASAGPSEGRDCPLGPTRPQHGNEPRGAGGAGRVSPGQQCRRRAGEALVSFIEHLAGAPRTDQAAGGRASRQGVCTARWPSHFQFLKNCLKMRLSRPWGRISTCVFGAYRMREMKSSATRRAACRSFSLAFRPFQM